ncbi:hypothetical protein M3Y97_00928700 [Aphelenchoides bicaudatus]|nr:hypothetical protein M3Y97_00928700 [Aphelenchoides bicaudatus]
MLLCKLWESRKCKFNRLIGILAATANSNFHEMDQLKKIFVSARSRVISTMEDVYTEFSHHRTHGAVKALQVDADPLTRMRAAEQILIKIIEELFQLADNDLDRCDARTLALIMSVATVLKILLNPKISHAHWEKLLDKCPTFVTASTKSSGVFKIKPALISKKSIIVKDHQFTLNPVFLTVHCYQCREAIWGVQPQAYFCQNCDVIVHKQCTGKLADRCYPASQHHKQKTGTLASASSRLRTTSALNLQQPTGVQATIQAAHQTRQPLGVGYKTPVAADYRTVSGQRGSTSVEYRNPAIASSSGQVAPVFRKPLGNLPSDTRSMGYDPTSNSKHIFQHMESVLSPSDLPPHQPPPAPGTSAAVSLNEPARLHQQAHVQVSPTQPQVIQRLVSGVHHGEHAAKSTSSDSGIGAEMERPVSRSQSMKTKDRILNQLEEVSEQHESDAESSIAALPSTIHSAIHSVRAQDIRSVSGSSSHSIGQDEAKHMLERVEAMCEEDSDLDADVDIPPLDQIISWQVLKRIDPKLRKLQESINEFYHTERTHVRNLKVICRFFFKPIVEQKLGSREFVKLVFGNLDELLELHSGMFQRMRVVNEQWKKDPAYDGLYGRMGETIANFFNGEDGEKMQKITAAFCQDQQQGLRVLAERRQKDEQLAAFLIKAESNPLCRKFQLKDLMPVEIQRLSKFPLLLDSILRYTNESSDEFEQYTKASMGAKRLLSAVNTAKRDTENRRYLEELNKKIEMPSGNRASDSYIRKYFDIMQYRYVYDGDVVWRHSRGKSDMRLILLDHLLILLTKGTDGKYYMRTQETNAVPLLWLPSVTVEEKPGDKRMFVIFYERDLRSYELQAQSITERKTWEQLLKSQIAAAKDELPHHFETDLVSLMPRLMRPGAQQPSTDETPSQATATASVEPLERVHVTTHPALVRANEIVVQQPTILEHARPVLSPRERLTRSDKIIMQALAEKHGIIAEQLMTEKKLTQEEMEKLRNRNPAELALSAIVHVNRLVDSINTRMSNKRQDSDKVGEEAERYLPYVPCYKLTAIAAPLLNHLTALSQVIKDQRQELAELRKEINKNKLEAAHQPDRSASEETLTETRIIR